MNEMQQDSDEIRQLLLDKLESLRAEAMKRKADAGLTDSYSWYESFNEANGLMKDFCEKHGYDITLVGDELNPPGNWRPPV